jgi:hypothetical protein
MNLQNFFFDLTGRYFWPAAGLNPEPITPEPLNSEPLNLITLHPQFSWQKSRGWRI